MRRKSSMTRSYSSLARGFLAGQRYCRGLAGANLEARGLKVSMVKLDPYINVDPGTMSPFQHGEVFRHGGRHETDLDLGHYERLCAPPPGDTAISPPGESMSV